jgi:exosortase family protein XrtF
MKENKQLYWFIAKVAILYFVWVGASSYWENNQDQDPNMWLTHNVGQVSVGILQAFGLPFSTNHYDNISPENALAASIIYHNNQPLLRIADPCNGLSLMALFLGFIIAFPGPWKKRLLFMLGGVVFIYLVNLLRVEMLIFTYLYYPDTFDFHHTYTYTIIVYLGVFYLWMLWAQKYSKPDTTSQTEGEEEKKLVSK